MRSLIFIVVLILCVNLTAASKDIAGQYLNLLFAKDYAACDAMSSPEMQKMIDVTQLQKFWEALPGQVGEFKSILAQSVESTEEVDTHIFSLEFSELVLDLKVSVDKSDKVCGLLATPSAMPKSGYQPLPLPDYLVSPGMLEEDVSFECGGYLIKGKLTRPGKGSYPLVLMITGSGPNDMDEMIYQRKPFRDIAHGLAKQGIATLRWSKRTHDYPKIVKELPHFTIEDEYLDEVRAARDFVSGNKSYSFKGIYVLGHSMGGMVMPKIAEEIGGFNGYIMLAGNARPLVDLIVEQYNYILGMDKSTKETKETLATIKRQVAEVKALTADSPESDSLLMGVSKDYWVAINEYDQVKSFTRTKDQFLILQGKKDYQVRMTDFNIWKKTAEKRGNTTLISYPKLDHLFMECKGKSTPQSYQEEKFVDPKVITDIAKWILPKKAGI